MNDAVKLHIDNILEKLGILGSYAEGDFTPVLSPFREAGDSELKKWISCEIP